MDAAEPRPRLLNGYRRVHPCSLLLVTAAVAAGPICKAQDPAYILPIGLVQGDVDRADTPPFHISPFAGQRVTVQGVITQPLLRLDRAEKREYAYFLQNTAEAADGDPTTSDGILLWAGRNPTLPTVSTATYLPRIGHEIVIAGTVRERFGMTQLRSGRLVRVVRTRSADDPGLTEIPIPDFQTEAEALLFWERHEGMQVVVPADAFILSGRKVFRRHHDAACWICPRIGDRLRPSVSPYAVRTFRDAHPLDDIPDVRFDNGNPNRVALESLGIKGALGDPHSLIAPCRTFDRFANPCLAAVYQRYQQYALQPSAQIDLRPGVDPSANGKQPPAPLGSHFTVATLNVENLYDARDDSLDACDAANDPGNRWISPPFLYLPSDDRAYRRKLEELALQILDGLGAPDILLLQEVEDQDILSPAPSGTLFTAGPDGRLDVLQELSEAIRRHHGPIYTVAADRDGADDRGVICAFLFRADRVQLRPVSTDHGVLGANPRFAYRGRSVAFNAQRENPKALNARLPSDVDLSTGMAHTNVFSRAVQVGWFDLRPGDEPSALPVSLYVLNNHFSSRPDQRIGQRIEQARFNAALAAGILAEDPEACVLVGGDLNVFPRPDEPMPDRPTDQLRSLYRIGMENVADRLLAKDPANAYTYVYRGQAGTLDHLFVSPSLGRRLDRVWIAHHNSDWPEDHPDDTPFGASDHDALLATFTFTVRPAQTPPH